MSIVGRSIVTDKNRYSVRPVLNGRLVTAIDVCGEFFLPVKIRSSRVTYECAESTARNDSIPEVVNYRIPTIDDFRTIERHISEIDDILRKCGELTIRGKGFWAAAVDENSGTKYYYAYITMDGELKILGTGKDFTYFFREIFDYETLRD